MALAINSYIDNQQPNQNQYLTGNPSTDNNAQTSWMEPSRSAPSTPSSNTGINGGANVSASQPTTTPQNGTFLGSITAGNVGQWMPGGYDAGKFNDPNKHDPKYDVGRILSQYQPGTAGLDAAYEQQLKAQGYTRVGKDKIFRPDVGTIDVGYAFGSGDPNQMSWGWMPQDSGGGPSFMGNQQGGNSFMQMLMNLFGQGNIGNSTGGWAQPIRRQVQQPWRGGMNPIGGGSQYNPWGPGGSSDNRTGPPGNYPIPNDWGNTRMPPIDIGSYVGHNPMWGPEGYDYQKGGSGLPPGIIFG